MDKERLMQYFDQHYLPKRDVLSRIPLGTSLDAFWQELQQRRRGKATMLPLHGPNGASYWFVLTDSMIAASEKIVEESMQPQPASEPAVMEEAFYTSFLEGSPITIENALTFMQKDDPPQDIQEQMLKNNQDAMAFVMQNRHAPVGADLIRLLAGILTMEMDGGGGELRQADTHIIPSMGNEPYTVPSAASIPGMMEELFAYLADGNIHPLLKAAVAHAWFMVVRPFEEGNERLARLIASMILNRAGYTFFSEISLSALLAQEGYGYYEAIANLLREDHGGDWTYLVEFYITTLGRGIDELRQRRTEREMDLAKKPLRTAPDPPETADVPDQSESIVIGASDAVLPEVTDAASAEEALIQAGFVRMTVNDEPLTTSEKVAEQTNEQTDLAGLVIDQTAMAETTAVQNDMAEQPMIDTGQHTAPELRAMLEQMAERATKKYADACYRVIEYMEAGKYSFTRYELTEGITDSDKMGYNLVNKMKLAGIVGLGEIFTTEDGRRIALYRLNIIEDYSPDVIKMIDSLAKSKLSIKDKRIGTMLKNKLDAGRVCLEDYRLMGEDSKWASDMKFAVLLGLVSKKTPKEYTINRKLQSGFSHMDSWQRSFSSAVYEQFGQGSFTTDMIVATLDYPDTHTSATLHTFTLMGILDCDKGGMRGDHFSYQFRVTPEEHPECFDRAA